VTAATYLDRILRSHRDAAAADLRSVDALLEAARRHPPARDFAAALRVDGVGVIAEVKRASPSKGELAPDLDPAALAAAYEAGGAACVSVLTDETFFGARPDDLACARAAVDLPVLRKDFTVSLADVCDARIMGADAVLLIVAALDPAELRDLHQAATDLGLAALVEVHDEAEAEAAIDAGARIVGINQRDLVTFAVDTDRAVRVARSLPDTVIRVAESGIAGPEDVPLLRDAGFDAILVGETLVRSPDAADAVAGLVQAGAR
jgi:indole-3-glycerol phosphate synthase